LTRHLKGLYERVARRLGVDPSYVIGVAHGEFYSEPVEEALEDELSRLLERVNNRHGLAQKASSKKSYKDQEYKRRAERNRKKRMVSI
jgi:hypothetical protein